MTTPVTPGKRSSGKGRSRLRKTAIWALSIATRHRASVDARPRKVDAKLDVAWMRFKHGVTYQVAQPRIGVVRLIGWAQWMVALAGVRHSLHEILAVPCHIHLDPVGHAQAARPFRRVVNLGERFLQARVGELPHVAADREALHIRRKIGCDPAHGRYTRSVVKVSSDGGRRGNCSRTALRSAMPSSSPTWDSSAPLA